MPDVQEVFRMATQKVRPDPGAMERQSRTQRRHSTRQRMGGYALLAILVIAAAVISVLALRSGELEPAGQPEGQPSAAELATRPHVLNLETGEATLLPRNLAGGHAYAPSPDGTRLAFAGSCDYGDVVRVANIDGTGLQTFPSAEGTINCAPRWSPDGSKLVYQERDPSGLDIGNLFVHDLATGERTQVTDIELSHAGWWFLSPSFTTDGQSVLFHLPRSSSGRTEWDVWSVPVSGGQPTLVLRDAFFPRSAPNLANGGSIAFLSPGHNSLHGQRLMTASLSGDAPQTVVDANRWIWWPTVSPDGGRIAYRDADRNAESGPILVVDVATGSSSQVAVGNTAEWLDNDTLIVDP